MAIEDYVFFPESPYTIDNDGGDLTISLTPYLLATYTANVVEDGTDTSWIKVTKITQPADNQTMYVDLTIAEQPLAESRTATIRIVGVGNVDERVRYYYYTINQEASAKTIDCSPASPYKVAYNGGDYIISATANFRGSRYDTFGVTTNGNLSEWADVEILDSRINNAIIQVSPTINTTAAARKGNMYIQYADAQVLYEIEQAGNPDEGEIVFEKNDFFVPSTNTTLLSNKFTSIGVTDIELVADEELKASIENNDTVVFLPPDNEFSSQQTYEIALTGKLANGNTISSTFYIFQQEYDFYPICRDTTYVYLNRDNKEYIDYEVVDKNSNEIAYSGIAYQMPDEKGIEINVNRIVSNNLNSNVPSMFVEGSEIIEMPDYVKEYDLTVNNSSDIAGYYAFYNDYSYNLDSADERIDADGLIHLSKPISKDRIVDSRQYFLATYLKPFSSDKSEIKLVKRDRFNKASTIITTTDKISAYTVRDSNLRTYRTISVNETIYNIQNTCYKYCLYYKNAMGGWDFYLIQGNDKQTDKITAYKYSRNYNNTIIDFESKKYLNVVNEKYTLYTNYLTDEEAGRMYNLLESTEVYLHNLATGEIKAVNITNSECEYKTYTNEGKKKFYYQIDVEASAEKVIK